MSDDNSREGLSHDVLWQDYYANLKTALTSMRKIFKTRAASGLSQDDIAKSLDIDKSLVSRRLNGEENFTLKTLSFMATSMKCRLNIQFRPYEELGEGNNFFLERDPYDKRNESSGIPPAQPKRADEPEGLLAA